MTQRERPVFLTNHLIDESDRYNMIEIPSSEKELFIGFNPYKSF